MSSQSYSVAEASRELGVSIPTLKEMYRRGELAGFLTPGGHLRVAAESLAAIRRNGRARTSTASAPSSVLQSRRERIEELSLEGQELRARRELGRLRTEEAEDAERRATGERAREAEREEQRELARAERLRQERLNEAAMREQRRARLRQQVHVALNTAFPVGLPLEKQRALGETLDVELSRASVEDAEAAVPIIKAVTDRFIAVCVTEERAQQARERILNTAVREIRWTRGSTESDESEAGTLVRAAFSNLSPETKENEMRGAAIAATAPIRERIAQREHRKEIVESGVREVFPYLERLHRAGGISRETLFDFSFRRDLETAVRRRLSVEPETEDPGAVRRLVHNVVDAEIERPDAN